MPINNDHMDEWVQEVLNRQFIPMMRNDVIADGEGNFIDFNQLRRGAQIEAINPAPWAVKVAEPNGPELWEKILAAVREVYEPEYCCIAGGAVRDFVLGKPPKDIDVYVRFGGEDRNSDDILAQADCLGWKNIQKLVRPYGQNQDTTLLLKAQVFGYNINFVNTPCKTGEEVVNTFDAGMCMAWYDTELHRTKGFDRDVKNNEWTITQKLTPDMKEHYERVNKRLGGKIALNEGAPWYAKFKT